MNYADPAATRHVVLGACRCPGKPHAEDTADVVLAFGYGELAMIYQAGRLGGQEQSELAAINLGVKRWNLVLPDGKPRPLNGEQVGRLRKADINRFMSDDVLGPAFEEDDPPNPSGAPSPSGSAESASLTPTTETPPSSTST